MAAPAPIITPQQRWRVRDTWVFIKPLTSSKGFGGFASAKDAVGMPSAVRADHRDWDAQAIEEEAKKQLNRDDALKSLADIDPEHKLSGIFYGHLFSTFPAMQEIFWRFNLFQSLEKIVAVLDPQNDLPKSLRALAERHRGRGILNADYDRIRQSLHYSLHKLVCAEFTVNDAEAWLTAWDVFAHAMKVPETVLEPPAIAKGGLSAAQDGGGNEQAKETSCEREIGEDELKKHNTEKDLWVVVEGGVYNCALIELNFFFCIVMIIVFSLLIIAPHTSD